MGFNSVFKGLMKLEFSRQIFENPTNIKYRPVGAELFHAGGRTDRRKDMTKLIVTFRNFANAPNKWLSGLWSCNYTRIRGYGAHRNLNMGRLPWENNNVHNNKPLPAFTIHKIYIKYALQNCNNREMWLTDISIFKTFRMAIVARRNMHPHSLGIHFWLYCYRRNMVFKGKKCSKTEFHRNVLLATLGSNFQEGQN